jgi:hypothetical protein
VQAASAAVLVLTASALASGGGAFARSSQVDWAKRQLGDERLQHLGGVRRGGAKQPVPPAFLVAVAQRQAALLGERHPSSASFVLTTHRDAVGGLGGKQRDDSPVYVLVLTGTFMHARHPPGVPPPLGTVARWIVDVATGQSIAFGLSNTTFDLAPLGLVGDLLPYLRGESTPACGAPDLTASASFYNGAGMSLIGRIHVASRSSQSCRLPKTANVFLTWNGRVLPVQRYDLAGFSRRVVSLLKPKQRASVYLQWWNWCTPAPWAGGRLGPSVELRLGRGLGTVVARLPDPGARSAGTGALHRGWA